ncbi:MAG: RNA polymerase factor sigma-54 [Thiotrichales bacterium]|nr:RNA polymerase factor sigma-54 [Thiotrichales bacterium]
MKPSLQLRVSQSLTMTPQLQQAIRLLQLSSIELQTEIQEALESNMMLEVAEDDGEREGAETNGADQEETTKEANNSIESENIPEDLPVDSEWDDIYDGSISYTRKADTSEFNYLENQDSQEKTLREHLLWQLNLTPTSDIDRAIAVSVIDALDDDGYLSCSAEELLQSLGDDDSDIGLEEVEATIRLVQAMEPTGVAARDLRECLLLQLEQLPKDTPWHSEAVELVDKYLDALGSRDFNQLMRRLKLGREELQKIVELIQTLNPRPGNEIQETKTEYVIPDVYVKKKNGVWKVELNGDTAPQLRINANYANMIRRADNSNDNNSLKAHLQEARWFIKSLQSRSETLLRVATAIVERQRAFLEYGEEAMKPLVLHDIAEILDMHESTISRVTTRKYMHTPRGIFELKYFFSSHVSTNYGGACSSTAIRALIKKLIQAETPDKPLSDSKIAAILSEQGINVARRTVAKYREAMSIPPSNERKRLA